MLTTEQLALLGGPKTVTAVNHRRWPEIRDEDRAAIGRVLDRGVLSGAKAPEVLALEREYAAYHGMRHCVAMNSGTAALHGCAVAVGVRPGDEVIVPAFTFIASAMAMVNQGARPVFCDAQERSFNLDPRRVEERITDRTRAIVAVHLHGLPADMDEILAIADRHGVAVIEDTAQAHGATYKGRKVGTLGACAGTSLQESKNLPAGEGGLFLTNDADGDLAVRRLRMFGEDLYEPRFGRYYWSRGIGFNYRMQELPAAFARSQLQRLNANNALTRANALAFTQAVAEVPGLLPPIEPGDRESVWRVYRVAVDPDAIGYSGSVHDLRDRVVRALDAEGVPVVLAYEHPLTAQPAFRREPIPWLPGDDERDLAPWDPAEFPVASHLVESSFLIDPATPFCIQDPVRLEQYAAALWKVMANVEPLLEASLPPLERRPPRPDER
jgi:perosamine synthetase